MIEKNRDITIDVSDEQIRELTALGFWEQDADGVLILTEDGNRWIGKWIAHRLAEAKP